MDDGMEILLSRAMAGDSKARENLIGECQLFIHKITCGQAKRNLEWGRDDELSIALIAFNEAIDAYCPEKQVPFPAFVRIVIQSRLKDYWRRENRAQPSAAVLLEPEDMEGLSTRESWEAYWDQVIAQERGEEIRRFNQLLNEYGINFSDLVKVSPQHSDTRQRLHQVAVSLVQSPQLMMLLLNTKKLPLQELSAGLGISRKTLERGRKYIIALALILQFAEEFTYLRSYIQIPAWKEESW